jgi:hypothetical protein
MNLDHLKILRQGVDKSIALSSKDIWKDFRKTAGDARVWLNASTPPIHATR